MLKQNERTQQNTDKGCLQNDVMKIYLITKKHSKYALQLECPWLWVFIELSDLLINAVYCISFKFLLNPIIEAKIYDNDGLSCIVSTTVVLPIYCQQINTTIVLAYRLFTWNNLIKLCAQNMYLSLHIPPSSKNFRNFAVQIK